MNIFLLLITTQLLGLCLGYEFEFGRYSIVSDDTRKNQLLVLNGSMQRRRTKQTKDSNVAKQMKRMKTLPEARYVGLSSCFCVCKSWICAS